ncbi:MAG: hypothetical protein LBE20_02025 [Deltaproteobacteria bacterium]|jgi:hypothetical protein|nr:hypothetical protein [Deltaproteobacteria bacterium]
MQNIFKLIILTFITCLALNITTAQTLKKTKLNQVTATASITSNLWNSENSIKFKSNQLLTEALAKVGQEKATIIFTSIPTTFLEGKTDAAGVSCATRFTETSKTPLSYTNKTFYNNSALLDWISDFSQGNGQEGKDLYKRCSGDCSPQYEYHILQTEANGYSLTAQVVCGKARNKSDDLYYLTTYILQ